MTITIELWQIAAAVLVYLAIGVGFQIYGTMRFSFDSWQNALKRVLLWGLIVLCLVTACLLDDDDEDGGYWL